MPTQSAVNTLLAAHPACCTEYSLQLRTVALLLVEFYPIFLLNSIFKSLIVRESYVVKSGNSGRVVLKHLRFVVSHVIDYG